jgi:hypothetical protein
MSGDDGENRILSAADLIAGARRTLKLSIGGSVIVGKVDAGEILAVLEEMPGMSEIDAAARAAGSVSAAAAAMACPEFRARMNCISRIIRMGTIEPRLFEDPREGPTPEDLETEDRNLIYWTILELSGFRKKQAGDAGTTLEETIN